MFGIFGKKMRKVIGPVICARPDHCISRKNIDQDALRVLYRLSDLGYTAYLVGDGVRDLLLGRQPKDFDVGTSAKPNEVKRAFRNCFLIGRRFRLAHVRFGGKVIETATFRQESQTVGEIIEHAAEGPFEDNTFGTPETDAYRRDFTVNGLFYDIKTFAVIDWVGGLKDLKKRLIRSIGDPMIRFREDPVRMMRAVKFASRLDFTIERGTERAIRKLHACIKTAALPRVCEEVFRMFPYGKSEAAFRMLYRFGLLGDLLPKLAAFIDSDGGEKSSTWKFLSVLDRYENAMHERGIEVSNGLRAAVLFAAMARARPGHAREIVGELSQMLKVPRATYFLAVLLLDSVKRLSARPTSGRTRFVYNRDFPDALDFNRIVVRTEGRSEAIIDEWDAISRKLFEKDNPAGDGKENEQGECHERKKHEHRT